MDTNTDGPAADQVADRPDLADLARELAELMRLTSPGADLPPVPAALRELDVPARLPSDPPWTPVDDHPFGFRVLTYDEQGRAIPAHPLDQWARRTVEAAAHRRVAHTVLYDRGTRVWTDTSFLGLDLGPGDGSTPPVLWETMIFLGPGMSRPAGTWRYTSRAAALHGHHLIVAALRAGYAARRPARRVRPRTAPGPWRRGYHPRGAW